MKRIQKFAAVNVIVALMGTGIPAMAAQNGHDYHDRSGMQYQSADRRHDWEWNDNRRSHYRRDYDKPDHDRAYRDDRRDGYTPPYRGQAYEDGYYDHRSHNGRAAAIIGGSAAAGALIGVAAGHAQGAVIGAVIGGIAGVAANAAVDHSHH